MPIRSCFKDLKTRKPYFLVCLLFALILSSNSISLMSYAASPPPSFSAAMNLSNDAGKAKQPAVSNNGQYVFVAWTEGSGGIRFRASPDGGVSWVPSTSSPARRISPPGGGAQFPVMIAADGFQSVSAGDVYVGLGADGFGDSSIFVAVSNDNGSSFKLLS